MTDNEKQKERESLLSMKRVLEPELLRLEGLIFCMVLMKTTGISLISQTKPFIIGMSRPESIKISMH